VESGTVGAAGAGGLLAVVAGGAAFAVTGRLPALPVVAATARGDRA